MSDYTLTRPEADTHDPLGVNTVNEPRPLTLRQRMRKLGIRSITPSEVIHRNGYAELKTYPQGEFVFLGGAGELRDLIEALEHWDKRDPGYAKSLMPHSRPAAHAEHPVRLTGWHLIFAPAGTGYVTRDSIMFARFYLGRERKQGAFIAAPGSDGDYVYRHDGSLLSFASLPLGVDMTHTDVEVVRISAGEVPTSIRAAWTRSYVSQVHAEIVYGERVVPQRLRRLVGNIYTRVNDPDTPGLHRNSAQYPCHVTGARNMMRDKNRLKEIGLILARVHAGDLDDEEWDKDKLEELVCSISNRRLHLRMMDEVAHIWNRAHNTTLLEAAECGHLEWRDDVITPGDTHQSQCSRCIDDYYMYCDETGDYRHLDNLYLHDDGEYYTYPEEDDFDEDDDEYDYPRDVGVMGWDSNVMDYHSPDPNIVSTPYGDFLMGVELEVVAPTDRIAAARHTRRTLCEDYAIMKSDSSLDAGGFEIVTAPRGLAEHIKRFDEWTPYATLRAWEPGCCGLHVHISSQAFTAVALGKFIEFINADENASLIKRIAGRHPMSDDQSRQYCQREGYLHMANPKKTLENKSSSRYTMVNTTNLSSEEAHRLGINDLGSRKRIDTVELRIFRASLNKRRLLAQVEFAHAAVMFTRWASMRELGEKHFMNWLRKSAGMYPNLARWLGVKANTKAVNIESKVRQAQEV